MKKLIVRIEHDSDIENPCENGDNQWTLYSFCSRHVNFKHPDDLGVTVGRNHVEKVSNRTLKRRLECGHAFWLGYFEHGQSCWFRTNTPPVGVEFQWDGVRYAGLLVWEHKPSEMGAKTYEDRAKDADLFLRVYTSWANGEGLYYVIEDEDGEHVDSCGGFYGCDSDYMLREMAHELIGHEFEVQGYADYLEDDLRSIVRELEAKQETTTA